MQKLLLLYYYLGNKLLVRTSKILSILKLEGGSSGTLKFEVKTEKSEVETQKLEAGSPSLAFVWNWCDWVSHNTFSVILHWRVPACFSSLMGGKDYQNKEIQWFVYILSAFVILCMCAPVSVVVNKLNQLILNSEMTVTSLILLHVGGSKRLSTGDLSVFKQKESV